jgi:hypothetical protein
MKLWISDEKCHFANNGDDQAIHNYLFYTGKLPYATAIPPRTGIVNTVGVDGGKVWKQHKQKRDAKTRATDAFDGVTPGTKGWIGPVDFLDYRLTDEDGYFINVDGTRSRVIHQFDRFGSPIFAWMRKNGFI